MADQDDPLVVDDNAAHPDKWPVWVFAFQLVMPSGKEASRADIHDLPSFLRIHEFKGQLCLAAQRGAAVSWRRLQSGQRHRLAAWSCSSDALCTRR